jgi:hypothetical protein
MLRVQWSGGLCELVPGGAREEITAAHAVRILEIAQTKNRLAAAAPMTVPAVRAHNRII